MLEQVCTIFSLLPAALGLFLWMSAASEFKIVLFFEWLLFCFHTLSLPCFHILLMHSRHTLCFKLHVHGRIHFYRWPPAMLPWTRSYAAYLFKQNMRHTFSNRTFSNLVERIYARCTYMTSVSRINSLLYGTFSASGGSTNVITAGRSPSPDEEVYPSRSSSPPNTSSTDGEVDQRAANTTFPSPSHMPLRPVPLLAPSTFKDAFSSSLSTDHKSRTERYINAYHVSALVSPVRRPRQLLHSHRFKRFSPNKTSSNKLGSWSTTQKKQQTYSKRKQLESPKVKKEAQESLVRVTR